MQRGEDSKVPQRFRGRGGVGTGSGGQACGRAASGGSRSGRAVSWLVFAAHLAEQPVVVRVGGPAGVWSGLKPPLAPPRRNNGAPCGCICKRGLRAPTRLVPWRARGWRTRGLGPVRVPGASWRGVGPGSARGVAGLAAVPESGQAPARAPRGPTRTGAASPRGADGGRDDQASVSPLRARAPFPHFFQPGSRTAPAAGALPERQRGGIGVGLGWCEPTHRRPVAPTGGGEFLVGGGGCSLLNGCGWKEVVTP